MKTPEGYLPIIHEKCKQVAYYIREQVITPYDGELFLDKDGNVPDPDDHIRCSSCGEEMALREFINHIVNRKP